MKFRPNNFWAIGSTWLTRLQGGAINISNTFGLFVGWSFWFLKKKCLFKKIRHKKKKMIRHRSNSFGTGNSTSKLDGSISSWNRIKIGWGVAGQQQEDEEVVVVVGRVGGGERGGYKELCWNSWNEFLPEHRCEAEYYFFFFFLLIGSFMTSASFEDQRNRREVRTCL